MPCRARFDLSGYLEAVQTDESNSRFSECSFRKAPKNEVELRFVWIAAQGGRKDANYKNTP